MMKKLIAGLMTLVLMLNLFTMTALAADATDSALVESFVDNVMDLENKEEFVDLLMVIRQVNDPDGMLDAYEAAFSALLTGQQGRIESFGVTMDAMEVFTMFVFNDSFTESNLRTYLGIDDEGNEISAGDRDAFLAAINSRDIDFRTKLEEKGVDISLLDAGFAKMDKLFKLLDFASFGYNRGLRIPFLAETSTGDFVIVRSELEDIIEIGNGFLENDIEDVNGVEAGLNEFVAYFNDLGDTPGGSQADELSDKALMYDYLMSHGFVQEYTEPTPPTPPTNNTGGGGGGSSAAAQPVIVVIPDDPVAQAAPSLQDELAVPALGGIMSFLQTAVQMTVPEGAFEGEATITVDVFEEEEIRLGGAISAGFEDADEVLDLAGAVYKFESEDTFDEAITISIPVTIEEGQDTHNLGIYQYNEIFGEWEFVGGTYDPETGMITVELEHFSYYAVLSYTRSFDDIAGSWAAEYIEYLASMRVINGRTDTSYVPDGTLTRAEFVKLLVALTDLDVSDKTAAYSDVSDTAWYAGYVLAAKNAGIVESVVTDAFRPDEQITREEMVTMLMNLYTVQSGIDYTTAYDAADNAFDDAASVADWAQEAVVAAKTLGIVNGKGGNIFDPAGTANRAEAAKIIKVLLDVLAAE